MTKEEKVLIDAIMALAEVIAEIKGEGEPSEDKPLADTSPDWVATFTADSIRIGNKEAIDGDREKKEPSEDKPMARYDGSYYESHMFSEATGPGPWPLLARATRRAGTIVGIASEDCKQGDLLTVIVHNNTGE